MLVCVCGFVRTKCPTKCAWARAGGTLGNFEFSDFQDFQDFQIFRFSDLRARAGERARVRGVPLEKNELLKFK